MPSKTDVELLRGLLRSVLSHYTVNASHLECDVFTPAGNLVVFQIRTEATDHRKVLGKHAASLRALKTLFQEIGTATGYSIDVRLRPSLGMVPEPEYTPERDEGLDFPGAESIAKTLEAVLSLLCNSKAQVKYTHAPGMTAFLAALPTPVSLAAQESLRTLLDLFGGKVRRKLYLEMR